MRIENTIDIEASADAVWAVTIDVESLPEITPTMTSVHKDDPGPLVVGSTIRIKQPGQGERTWTVTELVAPHRFVWTSRALGLTMTATHEITPAGDHTANRLAIDLDGGIARLLGPLLRRSITSALATENNGIKAAAEGVPAS